MRPGWILLVPAILLVAGTAGYWLIEGWPIHDALYMTVITLTTVGYKEVHPMSRLGESFTMMLALGGIFMLFYAATETVRMLMTGGTWAAWERRHMEQNLARMRGHCIVCGYGRVGRLVCKEFTARRTPYVVIERDAGQIEGASVAGGVTLHGDATSDEVLRQAGIERARALVAVVGKDADNLYITMSARLLNDRLFIVARADEEHSETKLMRAGANRVVAPYLIGGAQVAQAVLRPNVLDFIDLATRTEHLELQMEETRVASGSQLAGRTLVDSRVRSDLGLIIVGIKKPAGHMIFNPPPETVMEAGDILIALGDRKHLDQLEALSRG